MQNNDPFIDNKKIFRLGMKDGVPIGLGYLAVSFSLGIAARNAGLNAIQAFLTSFLCNASAGEYAGFTLIAAGAAYFEIAIMTFVANARYLLMSCAMSQRLDPHMPFYHRLFIAYNITDELFGIAIGRPDHLNPYYTYGAVFVAIPCWAIGTALGAIAGNILPVRVISAFSVALYGMFIAVFVPPARKNKTIRWLIVICFITSFGAIHIPLLSQLTDGTRTIILTVLISVIAAYFFPQKQEVKNK